MSRAIIYIPADPSNAGRWARACLQHIQDHGHDLTAVVNGVRGDDRWSTVRALMATDPDLVVIVALREHILEPPRFEIASDPNRPRARPGGLRRPQVRRR